MKKISDLYFRHANKKDLPEIVRIIKNSYHSKYAAAGEFYSIQQFCDPNYETENGPYYSVDFFVACMISGMKDKLDKPFETYVAEFQKQIVAFIVIEKNKRAFWVNNIMVKKEFQGRDIGELLFEFAVKNKSPLYLWVNSKNPAKKFWLKLGFTDVLQETLMLRENDKKRLS